ncbi:MAG: hypothetical protein WCC99_07745 [Candidatus Sulfotelmatobacter sp.]
MRPSFIPGGASLAAPIHTGGLGILGLRLVRVPLAILTIAQR